MLWHYVTHGRCSRADVCYDMKLKLRRSPARFQGSGRRAGNAAGHQDLDCEGAGACASASDATILQFGAQPSLHVASQSLIDEWKDASRARSSVSLLRTVCKCKAVSWRTSLHGRPRESIRSTSCLTWSTLNPKSGQDESFRCAQSMDWARALSARTAPLSSIFLFLSNDLTVV